MKISVRTRGESFEFDCAEGEKILHAGLRAGIGLPYECGSGTCGTCKAEVGKGEIDEGWLDAPGRAYVKSEKSEFLMCQATALGDCTIGVRANVARLVGDIPVPEAMTGRITKVEGLTHDVCRVAITIDGPVSFNAGQFMLVGAAAVEGRRAYSMADYRTSTDRLAFVIKQVPEGGFTDWLFAEDRTGAELSLFGPLGVATYAPSRLPQRPRLHRRRLGSRADAVDTRPRDRGGTFRGLRRGSVLRCPHGTRHLPSRPPQGLRGP